MQVIFVLFSLWSTKLKYHEVHIFTRTAKFVILPEPRNAISVA